MLKIGDLVLQLDEKLCFNIHNSDMTLLSVNLIAARMDSIQKKLLLYALFCPNLRNDTFVLPPYEIRYMLIVLRRWKYKKETAMVFYDFYDNV